MVRTSAPDSVASKFVDRDVGSATPGTAIVAEDLNNWQEEIANAVEGAGITLSAEDQSQLLKAIIALSKPIGEPFHLLDVRDPDAGTFPAVRIDGADDVLLLVENWPDLVPYLRGIAARSISGSTEYTTFSVTVSGSVVTFANTTQGNRLLLALIEDQIVHGSYTNWRTITIGGTDYAITAIDTGARTITVAGTPPSGAQTVSLYPHRVAGQVGQARLYKINGRALVSTADGEGRYIGGLRVSDRMQGWQLGGVGSGNNYYGFVRVGNVQQETPSEDWGIGRLSKGSYQGTSSMLRAMNDGANGTPRTGSTNDPRALASHLYIWGRRYIA